ncbi:MAG: cytosine permease [Clostridiales Family XIII bacterium]|jgi:NCS1 family nucleobase:cation symporter-1|nr:cytosine permease [Clostridiales Family XIII bacterium]
MAEYTQSQRGGIYELTESAKAQLVDSKYFNADLAPTTFAERTWNTYHISMLWVGMAICIPSFMMASGAVAYGLPVWAAVLNVILGNAIILVPIQLNSNAGTRYGIPFPVFSRMTFGMRGAQIPTISRAITACGWNMVQSVTGGGALLFMLKALVPAFNDLAVSAQVVAFLIFLFISFWLTASGQKAIRIFESFSSPVLIVLSALLLVWAIILAGNAGFSFGDVFSSNISAGGLTDTSQYVYWFLFALNGNIGFWATMALNIPDFSRYAKSQKVQFRGQMYGMLPGMAFCAIVGAFYAQATFLSLGTAFFNPVDALGQINDGSILMRVIVFIVGIGVVFATLTTNIAANVVAPANGFSNLAPSKIGYKIGALIATLVAIVYYLPYTFSDSFGNFMFTFLNVYGGFLAPLASIFIIDYFIIKKKNVDVASLYSQSQTGRYWYSGGFNPSAVIAWVAGAILPTLISLIPALDVGALRWINANAYLFAFFVALIVYVLIMPRNHAANISDEEEAALTETIA